MDMSTASMTRAMVCTVATHMPIATHNASPSIVSTPMRQPDTSSASRDRAEMTIEGCTLVKMPAMPETQKSKKPAMALNTP
ncbi:hypothetical protein D3C76_1444660 [compost metagenome]